LARLNEATKETVHLAVYEHGDVVYVDKLESRHEVVAKSSIGRRCPATCVATGRALLAYQPAAEIREVLAKPQPRYTEHTTTDPDELAAILADVRKNGYSTNRESFREGVAGIAAPIRDHTGAVVASVGLCLPIQRFGPERQSRLRDETLETATAVTEALGSSVDRVAAR
jgi:DNA-binding IclR family transcriptional regulator